MLTTTNIDLAIAELRQVCVLAPDTAVANKCALAAWPVAYNAGSYRWPLLRCRQPLVYGRNPMFPVLRWHRKHKTRQDQVGQTWWRENVT